MSTAQICSFVTVKYFSTDQTLNSPLSKSHIRAKGRIKSVANRPGSVIPKFHLTRIMHRVTERENHK